MLTQPFSKSDHALMRWTSLEMPHFSTLHTEPRSHICDISPSKTTQQVSAAASKSLHSAWAPMCEDEGTERCQRGVKKSGVVGFLPQHLCWIPTWRSQTVRAQQHFPISPAVLPWHTGAAGGCGCLPARHIRGDPVGSPSWQLSFRNWANVKHKTRQMHWLLGTWEMRPLAFKSL